MSYRKKSIGLSQLSLACTGVFSGVFLLVFFGIFGAVPAHAKDDARFTAFKECSSELAITGDPRDLDVDTREQFNDCLRGKGISLPDRPARSGQPFAKMKECLEKKGVSLPEPGQGPRPGVGGPPPAMDDTTKSALMACRTELGVAGREMPPGGMPPEGAPSRQISSGGGMQ